MKRSERLREFVVGSFGILTSEDDRKSLLNFAEALDFLEGAPQVETKFMGVPLYLFSNEDLMKLIQYHTWKDLEDSYKF